jgi:hypothetical protein
MSVHLGCFALAVIHIRKPRRHECLRHLDRADFLRRGAALLPRCGVGKGEATGKIVHGGWFRSGGLSRFARPDGICREGRHLFWLLSWRKGGPPEGGRYTTSEQWLRDAKHVCRAQHAAPLRPNRRRAALTSTPRRRAPSSSRMRARPEAAYRRRCRRRSSRAARHRRLRSHTFRPRL